ncbi:hypothetical protein K490DRAFT_43166 [Saccharata proteae CBS 121410]|uniref:MARVEL domain-containing protein n=1 Tax=Saccharata proteae CBS 121410 TaxID=1314787 RepID=A0A9P4HUA3_9PEZI|nr:hypothetical protein K490DRAFT_43166 [Saccharata proteae CBS 121410]
MRITQGGMQKSKTVLHFVQCLLVFVAGCITLAVLVKDGGYDGRTAYYFALCFFTVPAMLYLVMVPMWTRTVRFANAYAFAFLDVLYTILWFAAFIAVAVWNSSGMSKGAEEANVSKGNCSTFAYGSELKCHLSEATVGFGVIIFLLFVATSGISFYYVAQYKRTGILPLPASQPAGPSYADLEASNSLPSHQKDPADAVCQSAAGGTVVGAGEYEALHETETDEGRHPGHPLSWGANHPAFRVSTQNGGVVGESYPGAPSALSPTSYDEYRPNGGAVNYSHF